MCKQTCLEKGLSIETSAIKIVNKIQANFNQFAVGLLIIAICCFTICRHNYCLASTISDCFTNYFIFDSQAHSTAHLDNSIELKSVASVNANKLENSENIVTPEDQIAVYSEGFPRAIYKNSGDVVQ